MKRIASLATLPLATLALSLALPRSAHADPPGAASRLSGSRASHAGEGPRMRPLPAEIGGGTLLYSSDDAEWLAPQVGNHVELKVTGLIARAHVYQVFDNPSQDVVDAVYVFPLPERAAVDGLELVVGDRTIVGRIQEREPARQIYERARSEGKKASLLDQSRPNLFSTRVANLAPGERVEVHLHYQHTVDYDDGVFSLHFPSTITPRYAGGASERAEHAAVGTGAESPAEPGARPASFAPSGWGATRVDDVAAITPPMTLVGDDAPWLDVEVELDAGFPLRRVHSPSHAVQVQSGPSGARTVTLARGPVIANRDFLLRWQPELSSAPTSALFEEERGGQRYRLAMVLPPDPVRDPAGRLPRETTFVIDTSGSMSGTSIAQARSSLSIGLGSLSTRDRFNVIAFSDHATPLFSQAEPASPDNVHRAMEWVRGLDADGGTEMISGLSLALRGAGDGAAGRVRQIVFATDGSVGNEDQVLAFIHRHLGDQRLFTVGIGSAPNRYFMRGAARFGRGSFTHVGSLSEVAEKMNRLWRRLEAPVMTQLSLSGQGVEKLESFPARLPDLYQGEPLVIVTRSPSSASTALTLEGKRAGRAFVASLIGSAPGKRESGIHRLWARRKIEALMDGLIAGADESAVEREVVALALEHGLVSKYTSLIAVDDRRSVDGPGREANVALAVPQGNSMFGALPQTGTAGPFCLLVGALSAVSALLLARSGS